jgi:hypothetical protein
MNSKPLAAAVFAAALAVSGCTAFGEGLGRAVLSQMEGDPTVDTRACEIQGAPFDGILVALQAQDGQVPMGNAPASERTAVKLMIVHGIGSHHPGYSGRTVANLTAALGLNVVSPRIKSVDLTDPNFPGESIGTLTAQRFTDNARERELVVYELTWSRISDRARENLRFDSSQIHTRHRAPVNQLGKTFVNDVLVDPLVYVGVGRHKILAPYARVCAGPTAPIGMGFRSNRHSADRMIPATAAASRRTDSTLSPTAWAAGSCSTRSRRPPRAFMRSCTPMPIKPPF